MLAGRERAAVFFSLSSLSHIYEKRALACLDEQGGLREVDCVGCIVGGQGVRDRLPQLLDVTVMPSSSSR